METKLREDGLDIFLSGIRAVEPGSAVIANLALEGDTLIAGKERITLAPGGRILVVGAGKAGAPMAGAVEEVLGDRVHGGLVVVKYGHLSPVSRVTVVEAAHPVPDEAGLKASFDLVTLLEDTRDEDLVICLLSGGGSALLPAPAPPVTLHDKQAVTSLLLQSGAEIGEINCIRKHLSFLKGGCLARLAHPARIITLILSDVVGDPLDVIASGPTVGDPTTYADALKILKRYDLTDKVPGTVLSYLQQGTEGRHPDTPKPDDPAITGTTNLLIGTNTIAVQAAEERATELGYNTTVLSTTITGETRDAAATHAAIAREIFSHGKPVEQPACVLSGGETTVTIKGSGKGGRNQEFALAAALGIDGQPGTVILSGGTDGTDGPTDAAGAIVDGMTVKRARASGLDPLAYLDDNDSYHLFEQLEDLIITGPTLTNVMDLRIILVDGEKGSGV